MSNSRSTSRADSNAKQTLRKIIPVRASVFERRHHELEQQLSEIKHELELGKQAKASLEGELENIADQLNEIRAAVSESASSLLEIAARQSAVAKEHTQKLDKIAYRSELQLDLSRQIGDLQREAIWAEIFQQVISTPAKWMIDTSFAPGRWAVGFPYLYVLYRILNETKPRSILELGLGQSTKMIAQYAQYYPDTAHHVTEHDTKWIEFFKESCPHLSNTTIHLLGLTYIIHPEASHEIRRYKDFSEEFSERQFDLISIDAPFEYGMADLARIDILDILPNSLANSFAIIIDDYHRPTIQKMAKLVEQCLSDAGIEFESGTYQGEKWTRVIASVDNSFLCSM